MISVGIDVSKEKSTVCIVKPCGEIIIKPFEVKHTEEDLSNLSTLISRFDDEIKIVMEATGVYHLPILCYLKEQNLFVSIVNPLEMKRYRCKGIRNVKTDKIDSIIIANYGIDFWYNLKNYEQSEETYAELRLLGRQYRSYMKLRVENMLSLTHLLDYTMPGIKTLFSCWNKNSNKDKLADFVEEYWHFDNITKMTDEQFVENYGTWEKKNGYRQSKDKAKEIYALAKEGIPTLPSSTPSTKMLVQESVKILREVNSTLKKILSRMQGLAKDLPEYNVVRAMNGIGDVLAPRLIAEIGDVRRFHGAKALVAYAGIDAPPYQSGKFVGTDRHISKRGSSNLRKVGFEAMTCIKQSKPKDDAVYLYMKKKDAEGKPNKVAKIAGFNKFLHIYYARVTALYK